jgi:hypothetical protein
MALQFNRSKGLLSCFTYIITATLLYGNESSICLLRVNAYANAVSFVWLCFFPIFLILYSVLCFLSYTNMQLFSSSLPKGTYKFNWYQLPVWLTTYQTEPKFEEPAEKSDHWINLGRDSLHIFGWQHFQ